MKTAHDLAARLRSLATGRVEWRVQDPVSRCYCISFDRSDTIWPERAAREWLENCQRRWPDHDHAKYEVAEVRVFTELERVAVEAADALDSGCGADPEVQKVAVDIALWFVNGDRPDEFKLKEWAERLEPDAIAAAYLLRAAPQRAVPPGKWKVDMPDGPYTKMPGDPPGPGSLRSVIGGYVYDVEPRTGKLRASEVPRGVAVDRHQTFCTGEKADK